MKIYLDIDGVILANDKQVANHAEEFIKYLVDNHDVYWLTTHCTGDSRYTITLLKKFFSGETLELLERIKPTYWREFKTEAIDFKDNFLWLDDHLLDEEIQTLKQKKKFDSWVEVDLSKNPNQLKDFLQI